MTRPARPPHKTDRTSPLASVVAHPVFPVIAAVWFGALFGLGALAAGGEALASLTGHLHLAAIVPAAAPPLGTTAHVLIAIGLAGLGAISGLAIGLVLYARAAGVSLFDSSRIKATVIRARSAKSEPRSEPEPSMPKSRVKAEDLPAPTSVTNGPATGPTNGPLTPTPRVRNRDAHPDAPPRRPLVVTEDVLPYHTPISTMAPAPEAVTPLATAPEPIGAPPSWTSDTGFGDVDAHDHGDAPFGAFMAGESRAHDAELPPFFAGGFGDVPPLAESAAYGAGDPIILPPADGPQADLAQAQPAPVAHAEAVSQTVPMPLASQAAAAPHVPIGDVPVASLGLVQLIERLALAITVRQAHRAALSLNMVNGGHVSSVGDGAGPLLRAKPSRLGRFGEGADADYRDLAFGHAPSAGDGAAPVQLHDPIARMDAANHDWAATTDHDLPPRFLGGHADHPSTVATPADMSVFEATVLAPDDDVAAVETRYSSLVNISMVRPDLAPLVPDALAPVAAPENDPVVHFPFTQSAFTQSPFGQSPFGQSPLGQSPFGQSSFSGPRPTVADAGIDAAGDSIAPAPVRAHTDQADRALRDALATLRRMSAQR